MAEVYYTDGAIVNNVLDMIGWPEDKRVIDVTLGTTYPKWWTDQSPLQIIHDLELISLGFFYVDNYGNAVWEGRNTRSNDHPVAVASFDDTMVDLVYELDEKDIFNKIIITAEYEDTETIATPVVREAVGSVIFKLYWDTEYGPEYIYKIINTDADAISWGSPSVYWYSEDSKEWRSSALLSVTKVTETVGYCKVKVYNISPTGVASGKYRIDILYQYEDIEYSENVETIQTEHWAEDEDSQNAYGVRVKKIALPFRMDAQDLAESLVNFYLAYYKDPIARINITIVGKTDALLTEILTRQISDRITVMSSDLGMSADFYINKVTHKIDKGRLHKATYELIKLENVAHTPSRSLWVLGSRAGTLTLRPNGAGDLTELSKYPNTGEANWQDVDDVSADEDSSYVFCVENEWVWDLYEFEDHTTEDEEINTVRLWVRARCYPDLSGLIGHPVIKTHGTEYYGKSRNLTSVYTNLGWRFDTNPYTGLPWTWDEIDDIQAGVAIGGITTQYARYTQIWLEVNYGGIVGSELGYDTILDMRRS